MKIEITRSGKDKYVRGGPTNTTRSGGSTSKRQAWTNAKEAGIKNRYTEHPLSGRAI